MSYNNYMMLYISHNMLLLFLIYPIVLGSSAYDYKSRDIQCSRREQPPFLVTMRAELRCNLDSYRRAHLTGYCYTLNNISEGEYYDVRWFLGDKLIASCTSYNQTMANVGVFMKYNSFVLNRACELKYDVQRYDEGTILCINTIYRGAARKTDICKAEINNFSIRWKNGNDTETATTYITTATSEPVKIDDYNNSDEYNFNNELITATSTQITSTSENYATKTSSETTTGSIQRKAAESSGDSTMTCALGVTGFLLCLAVCAAVYYRTMAVRRRQQRDRDMSESPTVDASRPISPILSQQNNTRPHITSPRNTGYMSMVGNQSGVIPIYDQIKLGMCDMEPPEYVNQEQGIYEYVSPYDLEDSRSLPSLPPRN